MSMERPEELDAATQNDRPTAQPGGQAHGTLRSWLLVALVLAAFVAGGIALVGQVWWLFWVCTGVIVLSIPIGKVVGIMNDTVEWVVPLDRRYQPQGHILLTATGSNPARTTDPPE